MNSLQHLYRHIVLAAKDVPNRLRMPVVQKPASDKKPDRKSVLRLVRTALIQLGRRCNLLMARRRGLKRLHSLGRRITRARIMVDRILAR